MASNKIPEACRLSDGPIGPVVVHFVVMFSMFLIVQVAIRNGNISLAYKLFKFPENI